MMKKISILLVFLFVVVIANAQKKQNVYYLKNNGQELFVKDSADFIRIIQEPDSGETNYVLQEFYANGEKKTIGKLSTFEPNLVYEGVVVGFNNKGKKIKSVTYEKGQKKGMAFYFFNNGAVKKQVDYLGDPLNDKLPFSNVEGKIADRDNKLIYQADSLGKVYVKDGTGHLIETSKIGDDVLIEEGDYKDGFKEGVWKGSFSSGKSSYEETYQLNKLISGINTADGKVYNYTILMLAPQFKGGVNQFYKYIGNAIRYPADAVRNNITGKVTLSFVIQKDGSVTDILVTKSVHPSIDNEAIRVIKGSPKWIPAVERGLPVRVKYTIPIKFNLGR